ncbi:MAG: hypothetical protein ACYCXA_09315 [Actinomycetes bacterium]
MTANPPPRPALNAPAAVPMVTPAALVPAAVEPARGTDRPPKGSAKSAGKKPKGHEGSSRKSQGTHGDRRDQELVDLVVPVTRAVRRRLRVKATQHGMDAETATALLLEAWVTE